MRDGHGAVEVDHPPQGRRRLVVAAETHQHDGLKVVNLRRQRMGLDGGAGRGGRALGIAKIGKRLQLQHAALERLRRAGGVVSPGRLGQAARRRAMHGGGGRRSWRGRDAAARRFRAMARLNGQSGGGGLFSDRGAAGATIKHARGRQHGFIRRVVPQRRVGRPGDQPAAFAQRGEHLLCDPLHAVRIKIDQDIATQDHVETDWPGYSRRIGIGRQIEGIEFDQPADPLDEQRAAAAALEILAGNFRRIVPERPRAVGRLACERQRPVRNVGCDDARPPDETFLFEEDRQGIGLLARRTAGAPKTQPLIVVKMPLQFRQDLPTENLELLAFAKEIGFGNRQVFDEGLEYPIVRMDELIEMFGIGHARGRHGLADARFSLLSPAFSK